MDKMSRFEPDVFEEQDGQQEAQQDQLDADWLDVSGLFDMDTETDFPRSDMLEKEQQIGTPSFGDGDFDDWAMKDIQRRIRGLSDRERTALRKRVTHTKKKILTALTGRVFNKGKKGTLPSNPLDLQQICQGFAGV